MAAEVVVLAGHLAEAALDLAPTAAEDFDSTFAPI